MFCLFPSS